MYKVCLVAPLLVGLGLIVHADSTISYSSSVSGTFDFPGSNLYLQQFNPGLGTLNYITVSLSGSSLTSLSVYNSSSAAYGSPSSLFNDIQVYLGTSAFDTALEALNPNAGDFALPNSWLDLTSQRFNIAGLAPGDSISASNLPNTRGSGALAGTSPITSGTLFADLVGTGSVPLDVSTASSVDAAIIGGSPLQATEAATGTVTATVTYDYTIVPEPASLALLCVGLAAMVVHLRRRAA